MSTMDDAMRLAISAALIDRIMATADGRIVAGWQRPAFGRSVDAVRRQLVPIRGRASLLASFGREAGRARGPGAEHWIGSGPSMALEVAYAIRWMELVDRRQARPFASMISARQAATTPRPGSAGSSRP